VHEQQHAPSEVTQDLTWSMLLLLLLLLLR